jgi:hypothetical protein
MRWSAGEAEVERLLDQGSIERVQGAQADGESWLERARRGLDAARIVAEAAPDSSIILAYDAAAEATEALKTADEIIDAVTWLLPNLGFF